MARSLLMAAEDGFCNHLEVEVRPREVRDAAVIVGVNADLVAVFRHAPDKGLLTLDAVAHQEEGGLDLPESQTVQQAGGGGGSGAVVKGESHQGGDDYKYGSRKCGNSVWL